MGKKTINNDSRQENREPVNIDVSSCCYFIFGGLDARETDRFYLKSIPISNWYQYSRDFAFQFVMHRI